MSPRTLSTSAKTFSTRSGTATGFYSLFQRGEPSFYIEHIRAGIDVAGRDPSSLLVFSGGQTRREAGPRSEAQSYWNLAEHFRWWSTSEVSGRTTTEEFARDYEWQGFVEGGIVSGLRAAAEVLQVL